MRLAGSRRMFCEDFLAGEGSVSIAAAIGVATNVAICVPHVVPVFFVEDIISNLAKASAPEVQAFFERKSNAFEK